MYPKKKKKNLVIKNIFLDFGLTNFFIRSNDAEFDPLSRGHTPPPKKFAELFFSVADVVFSQPGSVPK